MKSFSFPYELLTFCSSYRGSPFVWFQGIHQNPNTTHTWNPSCSLWIPYMLLSILRLTLCMISVNLPKSNYHTHGNFHFRMNSLHFALRTEVHSWCDFSGSAKIPAPHTHEIIHVHVASNLVRIYIFFHYHLQPSLRIAKHKMLVDFRQQHLRTMTVDFPHPVPPADKS